METTSGAANETLNVDENFTIGFDGQVLGNISEEGINQPNLFEEYPPALMDFAGACCIIFMIFGIPANTISIVALAKAKKLRNITTPLVINLCVIDLMFCCFNLPPHASVFLNRRWLLGDALCKFFSFLRFISVGLNLSTVMAIAVNRYVLIVHPKYYGKIFNKRTLILTIVSIWVVSILILTPSIFEVWGRFGYDPKEGMCSILPDKKKRSQKISLFISTFVVPSIVFVYCYVRIYWVVRKSHIKATRTENCVVPPNVLGSVEAINENQGEDRKSLWMKWFHTSGGDRKSNAPRLTKKMNRNMRLARTILVIFCTIIICYLPQALLKAFNKDKEFPVINILGYLGMYFPNCINPVIYIVMSKEYRQSYRDLMNCYRYQISSDTGISEYNC